MKGDLTGLLWARHLSRAAPRPIRRNLALGCNAPGVPDAADLCFPVFGVLPSPATAALATSLSPVTVSANALPRAGSPP